MHTYNSPRKLNRTLLATALLAMLLALTSLVVYLGTGQPHLVINEFMASNRVVIRDEGGDYPDWIEIYNPTRRTIDLSGYWLSDDSTEPLKWVFPPVSIDPDEYVLVFASGKDRRDPEEGELHTNFRISRSGDTLILGCPEEEILEEIIFEKKIPSNISYGRIDPGRDEWAFFLDATPGEPNDTMFYEQVVGRPHLEDAFPVYINEFLVANKTSLPDDDGELHEWIELYNSAEEPVNLEGFWLSDKESNPYKWRFPEVVIEPGSYLVVFASGKNRYNPEGDYLHTGFGLNDQDDELVFKTPEGKIIDLIPIRDQRDDISYGRKPGDRDRWLYFPRPTPGEKNYTAGFDSLGLLPPPEKGFLRVSEVMAENLVTIADEDGDYPGWIEIYNAGTRTINLEGFGLSDREDDPFRWVFPKVEIGAGECLLVFASRKDRRNPDSGHLHTNYQIQATGETVVLTNPVGQEIDRIASGMQKPDISVGRLPGCREGRYYFKPASPGEVNPVENAHKGYASSLRSSHSGGFYDGPLQVSLETILPGGEIRYSLDGREPSAHFSGYPDSLMVTDSAKMRPPAYSEGQRYEGPISINETTVLRARVYRDGYLPGPVFNATFFINEEQNLPVVSVMGDPDDFFDPRRGIYMKGPGAAEEFPHRGANYWQSIELPIHLEFFEADGTPGFKHDFGLRIAGQYSRAEPQKSFNIFARNIYGYNEFKYPFFPEFYPEKPLANKAISLRTSGQDWRYSKIRDIFMTSLLENSGLDYQAHRQAVLYINGQYWGIYNIRERINEHFLAYNHGVDPDKVDLLQGNGWVRAGSSEHYFAMVDYARRHNLADPEHYAKMQTMMDVDNYIDFWIAQIYFAHTDSANIRFWREQDPEGRWRWIVFDLDWAFWSNNYSHNTLRFVTNPAGTGYGQALSTSLMNNLLASPAYRDRFVERFAYHLNHTFETGRVLDRIDTLATAIEPEMPRHLERWNGRLSSWENHVDILRTFAEKRQPHLLRHIQAFFSLSDEEMKIFDAWEN